MGYITFFIYFCACVCFTYGQSPATTAACAGIQCSPPNCMDSYTPLGGCCPVCPGLGSSCRFRGNSYRDGEGFRDDCNTCTCSNGDIACTQMTCLDDKPGSCPFPTGPGICVESCYSDTECPRRQKCCSNGCGHSCMRPQKGKPCLHKGVLFRHGASFKDDCNTCSCNDGISSCTEIGCPGKPGSCPIQYGNSVCYEACVDDYSCSGDQKCCTNGCGQTCMSPYIEGKPCVQNGITYKDGENFMNDCNTCRCRNGVAGCTRKGCPKKPCFHNGVDYADGETFQDYCNTCVCSDGTAECTLMACPDVKPGECPPPIGAGICIERCTTDLSCPGREKCCSNGCGNMCLPPRIGGMPCYHNGINYNDGETFKEDCNSCICNDGIAGCTKMICPGTPCLYKGVPYKNGETFKDDCNTCRCSNGKAACTLMACPGKPCLHRGVSYNDGESFKDDCNTCRCSNGRAACTRMACPGKPCLHRGVSYNDGESFKDDCNTCKCSNGRAACTRMACPGKPCLHRGASYNDGESFKDDCNTCKCSNGRAACTRMACPGKPCLHRGVSYNDGESFKDDCNTCKCSNGRAACTLMACPDVKPGDCPPPLGIGICVDKCVTDSNCPGTEKCCSNGCGNLCLPPRNVGQQCTHNGLIYQDGETFKDDCNKCNCNNGIAECTNMACTGLPCLYNGVNYIAGETFKDDCNTCTCTGGRVACTTMTCPEGKPGTCPSGIGIGTCVVRCTTDASCPGIEKCCSNGCGTACMLPLTGGKPCVHNGLTYSDGQRFNDRCNKCFCSDGRAECTQMSCPGTACFYKGKKYRHGETFKENCNTCTCNDGIAGCTLMACPDEKRGNCPLPVGVGICVDRCTTDFSCPGLEKCCSNGCGTICQTPIKGRSCFHNGIEYLDGDNFKDDCNTCKCTDGIAQCTRMACGGGCTHNGINYKDGERFKDDCNTCTCSNGNLACTLMACPGKKPGTCPSAGVGICLEECTDDASCQGIQKCCSNGCGHLCMDPDFGGRPCFQNGYNYTNGESFKDDCNTCTCRDGKIDCTLISCPPKKPCYHNGVSYKNGDQFKNVCNTCICTDSRILCTFKACGKSCDYKGKTYPDGESFKESCNTCTCNDGSIGCTLLDCSGDKPGTCPRSSLFYRCRHRCNGDKSCPGKKKCCNNWCGHTCMDPVGGDKCAGVVCPPLDCVKGYTPFKPPGRCCEICRPPIGEKPGRCPTRPRRGPCYDMCTTDYSCPGQQKCCSHRCGRSCLRPIGFDRCHDVSCPSLRCLRQFRPPGRCCPVCRGRGGRGGRD